MDTTTPINPANDGQSVRYTFRKSERLCLKKEIEALFRSGKTFTFFPFRLVYHTQPDTKQTVRIAVSVPKKSFKRAVKRNLLKRRIKESYRKYKPDFYDQLPRNISISIMLIYVSPEITPSTQIAGKLGQALDRLAKRIQKDCGIPVNPAD